MEEKKVKPCWVLLERTPKAQTGLSVELKNAIEEKNLLTTRTRRKIMSDLDEINKDYIEIDNKRHRALSINEIISSEKTYIQQLENIKVYFMKPIKERSLLNDSDFEILFGSIPTIYNISCELLKDLIKNRECVGKAFEKMAPYFKMYSVYAYNYKNALELLSKIQIKNSEFAKFLESQETRPEVQSKLSALLIAPIQRVPRYRLLLKQLLQHTASRDPSYSLLRDSLKNVENAANHINSSLKDQENAQRLIELQRNLRGGYPSILKADRKLIKEGILKEVSPKNNDAKRYLILMNDIFMLCKLKKDNPNLPNALKCTSIFPLNKCKITENLSKGAFNIMCENDLIVLYHEHAKEAEEWVQIFKNTINDYLNNRRTLRKDSSSRRPAHNKHVHEYQDLGISPGQPRKIRRQHIASEETSEPINQKSARFTMKYPLLTKRKSIRHPNSESAQLKMAPQVMGAQQSNSLSTHHPLNSLDSLYPLREQFLTPSIVVSENQDRFNELASQCELDKDPNIFLFGEPHQPRGFRFTMGNVFSNLGNSIKRFFGFGENTS